MHQEFVQKLIALGLYKPRNMTERQAEDFIKGFMGKMKYSTNEAVKSKEKCV